MGDPWGGVSSPCGWTKVGRLRPSQSTARPLEGKVGFPSLGLVGEGPLELGKLGMEWKLVWQPVPGDGGGF